MEGSGYFYRPTVLDDIPEDATLLKEEIFGPVAPVASFDSEEAAVAAANDTEYGLVAYVYTSDLKRALRVCEGIETGMVGLNQGMVSNASAPFGGIKHSGFGREGGSRASRSTWRRNTWPSTFRSRCASRSAPTTWRKEIMSDSTMRVINPATRENIEEVPISSREEVDTAVERAQDGFRGGEVPPGLTRPRCCMRSLRGCGSMRTSLRRS